MVFGAGGASDWRTTELRLSLLRANGRRCDHTVRRGLDERTRSSIRRFTAGRDRRLRLRRVPLHRSRETCSRSRVSGNSGGGPSARPRVTVTARRGSVQLADAGNGAASVKSLAAATSVRVESKALDTVPQQCGQSVCWWREWPLLPALSGAGGQQCSRVEASTEGVSEAAHRQTDGPTTRIADKTTQQNRAKRDTDSDGARIPTACQAIKGRPRESPGPGLTANPAPLIVVLR